MEVLKFDSVKVEKTSAMILFRGMRLLMKLHRFVEIALVLFSLYLTVDRLPFAARLFRIFFTRIAALALTPIFAFLLANFIIAFLILNSCRFSSEASVVKSQVRVEADIASRNENFEKSSDDSNFHYLDEDLTDSYSSDLSPVSHVYSSDISPASHVDSRDFFKIHSPIHSADSAVFEDKQVISQKMISRNDPAAHVVPASDSDANGVRIFRRSKSEKLSRKLVKKKKQLRRFETERARKTVDSPLGRRYPEDELSNEEFQHLVESFIAKHLIFRRQESFSSFSSHGAD